MLFNTPEYLLFFLLALAAGWLLLGMPRLRIWVLLLASYYFYASNNGWLLVLILFSTQFDYFAAMRIADSGSTHTRKTWLTLSMVSNLGLLGFFKYANFFADTIVDVAGIFGIQLGWFEINVLLPVGISFYTFESMSYVIDVYRGHIAPERRWHRFAFYIAYFPQLIAGPIVRAGQFLPQLDCRPTLDTDAFEWALFRILRGLFKKIVLADTMAVIADEAFAAPGEASQLAAWLGVYAFTLQIYFDFSGYTDIALGCARLMGFKLPENFNNPYAATSLTDFWRRWHLSLSTWLRDYLYFPLGGSRMPTSFGVCRNLIITMTLAGLWHGAAWHFVIWGLMNGVVLASERVTGLAAWTAAQASRSMMKKTAIAFLMFNILAFFWVPFRAPDMISAWQMIEACFGGGRGELTNGVWITALVVIGGWSAQQLGDAGAFRVLERTSVITRAGVYGLGVLVVLLFNADAPTPFIYFRF